MFKLFAKYILALHTVLESPILRLSMQMIEFALSSFICVFLWLLSLVVVWTKGPSPQSRLVHGIWPPLISHGCFLGIVYNDFYIFVKRFPEPIVSLQVSDVRMLNILSLVLVSIALPFPTLDGPSMVKAC